MKIDAITKITLLAERNPMCFRLEADAFLSSLAYTAPKLPRTLGHDSLPSGVPVRAE